MRYANPINRPFVERWPIARNEQMYDDDTDYGRWSWVSFWLAGVFWLIVIPIGVLLWQKAMG